MKKTKILQVTGSLNVGGIEKLVFSFYERINREKFQMDFLLFDEEKSDLETKIQEMGGNVYRITNPKKNLLKYYVELKRIIKRNGPYDAVHSHLLFNTGIVMRAAYKCNVPIRIAHSHDNLSMEKNSIIRKIYIKLMRKYLHKYSNKFCACSSLAGNYLFGKEFFQKNGTIIYNSIDISKYKFNLNKRTNYRKELGIKDDDIVVGNIGRIVPQKNQEFIIKLAKKLENLKFVIVGDGELLDYLKKKTKDEKISNRVIFTGIRNDVDILLNAFDIFILPSVHEGLGIVLIEAQSNGLPCIVPKNVVPEEARIIDNFVFTEFPIDINVDLWCKEIERFVGVKRTDINDFSNNFSNYSFDKLIKSLVELYTL